MSGTNHDDLVRKVSEDGLTAYHRAMFDPTVPRIWPHVAEAVVAAIEPLIEQRIQEARAEALQDAALDSGDEYHTMAELYDYRMLYNAHAAIGWLAVGFPVVKSWRHSDGEECFGGGWFIVSAQLPTGQVSNHYEAEHWDLFRIPAVGTAPAWDGHTPAEAADRLRSFLSPGAAKETER